MGTGDAYQVQKIKKKGKYYCHITFELLKVHEVYTGQNRIIDINPNLDGFALTMIDKINLS
ncbi:hypothetical protein N4T77_12625 [Clostridium sp. CX1]|uniref:hypothetical protein n=1 Tax=Clostridium sp. CX1 TaxID=2978346 RepID=UPI0021BFD373|nr:hypothetical protein [Clostridium sp. CX1]MCT8977448.1 hypothetical protein [Clostridium sp. CX1]